MNKAICLIDIVENIKFEESLIKELISIGEAKWSAVVTAKAKWHPPEGLFVSGTATEIARALLQTGDPLRTLIQRLVFYINRAGVNLNAERRKAIQKAMDIVRKAKG